VLALCFNDGRDRTTIDLNLRTRRRRWDEGTTAAVDRECRASALALKSASQFRPDGPSPLESADTHATFSRSRSSVASTAETVRLTRQI
jgi:hypothetical protein